MTEIYTNTPERDSSPIGLDQHRIAATEFVGTLAAIGAGYFTDSKSWALAAGALFFDGARRLLNNQASE